METNDEDTKQRYENAHINKLNEMTQSGTYTIRLLIGVKFDLHTLEEFAFYGSKVLDSIQPFLAKMPLKNVKVQFRIKNLYHPIVMKIYTLYVQMPQLRWQYFSANSFNSGAVQINGSLSQTDTASIQLFKVQNPQVFGQYFA
ncbi:unnamed protein product [Caenorhabditis brenneri]